MERIIGLYDGYFTSIFNQSLVTAAAVVIVKDGKILYMKSIGMKDLASGEPVDNDTLFILGSASKQFTATNVAQLVSEGLMGWDDPIIKYYNNSSEFQLYDPNVTGNITIRDCFLHQSGLPDHVPGGDAYWMYFNHTYPYILHQARYIDNTTPFRSTWQYNNIIYSLPAYSAARVENTTWNELIKEKLLNPLGMTTATTTFEDFLNTSNHVTPYALQTNHTFVNYEYPFDAIGPAGVIGSSISEMANWLKFQIADTGYYNGIQIVSKKDLDETRTGQINCPLAPNTTYGFGWMITNNSIGHMGDTNDFHSTVKINPANGLGIAILTDGGLYAAILRNSLSAKLSLLLGGDETTDPWIMSKQIIDSTFILPDPTPITLPLSTYIGIYHNANYGNINITSSNNSTLTCYYGNNSQSFELQHLNDDKFIDIKNTMPGQVNITLSFSNISNGTANQLRLNQEIGTDEIPIGTFNRTNSTE